MQRQTLQNHCREMKDKVDVDTGMQNDEGKTALDIAKENNYQEIMELLK